MDQKTLRQIERTIGYDFSDSDLLAKAFTHASAVENRQHSNERLEFLGDSVLALVICQKIFERFPKYPEGDLTKIKSMLVSRKCCAVVAGQLGLHKFLKVGKGMASNRALTGSLAAGVLEAVIGAIYVDADLKAAQAFILTNFASLIEQADTELAQGNFKSLLQQHAQQELNVTPAYELLDEKGPDHNKCFEIQAVIAGRYFESAWGVNKKEAEQKAAYNALVELDLVSIESEND